MPTPIHPLEGVATDSTGELVIDPLADRVEKTQAVTDLLPDAGALTSIAQETTAQTAAGQSIQAVRHVHTTERWWGAVAAPDETNAIEANVDRPFSLDSGANTWGTAIPILGTADNPVAATDTLFDARELLIVDTQHASAYRLRLIWGTGTSAAAIAAGQWSEDMFFGNLGAPSGTAVEHRVERVLIGWKMWAQVWNVNNNSTIEFFYGAHGYLL